VTLRQSRRSTRDQGVSEAALMLLSFLSALGL